MQQFVVPQFIDREDKILGPITVRQFLILLITVIVLTIMYRILDFSGFIVSIFLVGGPMIVLAFVKVNGRPFHFFLLSFLQTVLRPAIRIWYIDTMTNIKKKSTGSKDGDSIDVPKSVQVKRVSSSRLSELSLMVDTGGAYIAEEVIKQPSKKTN